MDKVMEIFSKYGIFIYPIIGFILGKYVPVIKFKGLGEELGAKLPKELAKPIAERIDAFADGLYDLDHNGDQGIISNEQLAEKVEGLKIDLLQGK